MTDLDATSEILCPHRLCLTLGVSPKSHVPPRHGQLLSQLVASTQALNQNGFHHNEVFPAALSKEGFHHSSHMLTSLVPVFHKDDIKRWK